MVKRPDHCHSERQPSAPVRRWRLLAASVSGLMLAACMAEVPVKHTDIEKTAPDKVATIIPAQTNRAAARQALGDPWLSSDIWSFDLFRTQGRDVRAPVMFVFWWPVPMGVAIDKMTAYVLVQYDPQGVVLAEAHDMAVDPSIWASMENKSTSAVGVQIEAADLRFGVYGDQAEQYLSIAAERGKAYLDSHPWPADCRLVAGFDEWGAAARVALDDGSGIALPDRLAPFHEGLLVLRIAAGPHRIHITPVASLQKFNGMADFTCKPGDTVYAVLSLAFVRNQNLFFSVMQPGVDVSTSWPAAFDGHRWLVWGNGRWLLPPSPDK